MDLTSLIALLQNPGTHDVAIALVVAWLVSAALHAMPAPGPDSGVGYRWLFTTVQTIGANLGRLKEIATPPASPPAAGIVTLDAKPTPKL